VSCEVNGPKPNPVRVERSPDTTRRAWCLGCARQRNEPAMRQIASGVPCYWRCWRALPCQLQPSLRLDRSSSIRSSIAPWPSVCAAERVSIEPPWPRSASRTYPVQPALAVRPPTMTWLLASLPGAATRTAALIALLFGALSALQEKPFGPSTCRSPGHGCACRGRAVRRVTFRMTSICTNNGACC